MIILNIIILKKSLLIYFKNYIINLINLLIIKLNDHAIKKESVKNYMVI